MVLASINVILLKRPSQHSSLTIRKEGQCRSELGGWGGLGPPKKILPSSKSFFLLLFKYFDWKDTKLHANYFLYNEKCCFPSYKSNTVSFISINYKSSFFSLCIEIYLCTPCALFSNCFPKLRELKRTHL